MILRLIRLMSLFISLFVLRRHIRSIYLREIENLFKPIHVTLPIEESRRLRYRIRKYTLDIAPFFSLLLYRLHNLSINQRDHRNIALLGASTAFFDMIYDENWHERREIQFPIAHPKDSIDQIFNELYFRLANSVHNFKRFKYWAERINRYEQESMLQKNQPNWNEIQEITKNKGGTGLMIFRSLIPLEISDKEEKALMVSGEIIQMMDDLVDVWQDLQENIKTLYVFFESPESFAEYIETRLPEIFKTLIEADIPKKDVLTFCDGLYSAFLIGKVHARHLTKYMHKTGKQLFDLNKNETIIRYTPAFVIEYLRTFRWNRYQTY